MSSNSVRPRSNPPRKPTGNSSSTSAASSSSARSSSSTSANRHPPSTSAPRPTTNGRSTSQSQSRSPTRSGGAAPPPPPPPPSTATTTPSTAPNPALAQSTPFDIHSYPSAELLRLLASLLTQIASTNDKLTSPSTSPLSSHHPHQPPPNPAQCLLLQSLTTASQTSLTSPTSALTFHARNIPTISLESYLLRILKYCPTTNEVFLSLLVYFDRMSKLAGEATGRTFVIDSFNVHRLVIAGVTVASKFFSDVFYTNSRYAKVGGLPQPELNQLELQFLLLNDFRLVICAEEMQRYAEQLIVFSEAGGNDSSTPSSPLLPSSRTTHSPTTNSTHHPPPTLSSHILAQPVLPTPPSSAGAVAPMHAMGAIDAYGGRIISDSGGAYRPPSLTSSISGPSSLPTQNGVTTNHHNNKTPSFGPHIPGPYASAPPPIPTSVPVPITKSKPKSTRAVPPPRWPADDSESETGTETETENETEGGWTTDDEPTIRPGGGGGRGAEESESDCASLCSTGTEDGDRDDEDDEDGEGEGREVEIGDTAVHRSENREVEVDGESGDEPREWEKQVDGEGEEGKGERTPEQKGKMGALSMISRVGGGDGDEDEDYAMASP